MSQIEMIYQEFRDSLSDVFIKNEFAFVVLEPGQPPKFGYTIEQHNAIYQPYAGGDPSLEYPGETSFIRVEDGWVFTVINKEKREDDSPNSAWEDYESWDALPENVKTTLTLLDIPNDYGNY